MIQGIILTSKRWFSQNGYQFRFIEGLKNLKINKHSFIFFFLTSK